MATIYFTASSLDGFIATKEQSLDWLLSRDVDPAGEHGYQAFVQTVGALVMGSTTYEWMLDHVVDAGEPWPYDMPTWVLTSRQLRGVEGADVRFVRGEVASLHPTLVEAAAGRHVWVVGGGPVAAQFADAGLLDEVWVQFAPVTLGAGMPLLPTRLELALDEVVRNRDFACTRYSVVR